MKLHFDKEKEGGSAANANGLNGIRECAVGPDKMENGGECGPSFKFLNERGVVLDVCVDGNAVRFGRGQLVVMIALREFIQSGGQVVEATDFFFARCCLGKVPGGAPFSQLHKGDGKIARTKTWYTSRFVRVILAQGPC